MQFKHDEMIEDKIFQWFATGEIGASSQTIVLRMIGKKYKHESHPLDPDDFNRCIKLLDAVPEIRNRLNEMSKVSPEWAN